MITTINITSCTVQGNVRGGKICLWIKHKLIMVLLLFNTSFIFSSKKITTRSAIKRKYFSKDLEFAPNLKKRFWLCPGCTCELVTCHTCHTQASETSVSVTCHENVHWIGSNWRQDNTFLWPLYCQQSFENVESHPSRCSLYVLYQIVSRPRGVASLW